LVNFIVTTTINGPTKAIDLYDQLEGWKLIVVGDLKTPQDYIVKNGIYLSPSKQEEMHKELSDLIGWNCIQRRNFGFMKAIELGAELVATIDDDNIPYTSTWGKTIYVNKSVTCTNYFSDSNCFDPLWPTNHNKLWHRGFPIQNLAKRNFENKIDEIVPDIQANFWNGDPDIDAICRMEHAPHCNFEKSSFPFFSREIAPFNSQNTILNSNALKEYFLFPHVGRMDDIWASFYLQSMGFKVIFAEATVYQERNEHDLTIDFQNELLGYINNNKLIDGLCMDPNRISNYLPEKTHAAWNLYKKYMT
jgi:hypothetical protein